MYLLQKQEIDRLVEGYASASLGLFGLSFGSFLSLLVTDLTAPLLEPVKRYFVDGTVITGLASIVFLVFAVREWLRAKKVMADLEKEVSVDVDASLKSDATERNG